MADTFIINLAARYAAVFGAMAIQDKAYRNAVMMREDNDYKVELYPKYDNEIGNVKLEWDGQELEFNNVFIIGESQYFAAPPIVSFTRKRI